ncbi:hypothetical protein [Mycoplasma elephantis]|uniref:hypothetical protein n=1 Tax=Mycoplasma elephantis TaxID=114882 RepID=UPI00048934B1|nr:hypothetical protein [Mycoplasma elephantis]
MIIKLRINKNFKNHTIYKLGNVANWENVEIVKKNNLIGYVESNELKIIIDTNDTKSKFEYQLINKLPKRISDLFNNFIIKNYDFFLYSKVIKCDKLINSNLYKLCIQTQNNSVVVLTNREDIKVNESYWFALEGSILSDGSIIEEFKVNNISSWGMILSQNSILKNNNKELLFKENDLDVLFEGIGY